MSKLETAKKVLDFTIHMGKKHLPTLMSIGAGIGVVVTTCLTIKETPKAMEKVAKKKEIDPDISVLETAAVAIPEYAPALIAFAVTEGLIIGANHVNLKRIAALGALYMGATADKEKALEALKAAEQVIGKEKIDEIKKRIDPDGKTCLNQEAFDVEKTTKYGKNEKRPCIIGFTGSKFVASYNELEAGIKKSKESFSPVGDAFYISLGDVLYNLHAPACDAGDLLGFQNDFDAMIVECIIDGAVGWKVVFCSDVLPDYDSVD